jgi:predicted signal transduction protein with EAL and GGDEF domain/DNA-binding response OmpR family regulator
MTAPLPAAATPLAPREQSVRVPSRRAHDCAVLLVDDDGVARLLTASALVERGFRVTEAASGAAALELFASEMPDIVVLDALMPELDGFATCERLRKLPGGEYVPVLMLTGLDDETSIARAYEAGATDFFVKTNSQWTLLAERLRYLLRSSRMRKELAASQAKLTKAQRIARLGNWEWDLSSRWVTLSDECYTIAGLTRQEQGVADWFVWSRLLEEDRARVTGLFREALLARKPLDFECRVVRPSNQVRTVHVEAEMEFDDGGRATSMHGVLQDITERRQAEDQIRQLANFDSLTGLPNRRFFRDQLAASVQRAQAHGTMVAVLFIDIDRFKQANDTLGHDIGDQLLREVGKRLNHAVRGSDTVARGEIGETRPFAAGAMARALNHSVARLGGDEFIVLLTDIAGNDDVTRVVERLLEAIRQPIHCGAQELFVTASIGVSLFPNHGDNVDSLIRMADIAMYVVKDSGRNGWQLFDDAMNAATAQRWRLETSLHRALERNELVLHYQPKVDAETGAIVGAEALMRWQRDGELIPPAQFIAVAEESGLIVPITEWAIDEVCRRLLGWSEAGVQPVPVSINISSRHIQRASLIEPVQRALATSGLSAELLELELTETVLMQNIEAALPLLQALKRLGVSISIDDFGTGYSSLSYLKRLPIDTLKIDRSFVRELESSNDNAAIVTAIIAMGRSLNLRVVAEGVETRYQMQRLHEQGCRLMQGWLFAKAVAADAFLELLRARGAGSDWRHDDALAPAVIGAQVLGLPEAA